MENRGKIPMAIVDDIRRLTDEKNHQGVYDYLKGVRTVIVDELVINEKDFTEVREIHALETEEGTVLFAVRIVYYKWGEEKVISSCECYRKAKIKVEYTNKKPSEQVEGDVGNLTTVSKSELNYLRKVERHYNHLHETGVDNWGDYSYPEE